MKSCIFCGVGNSKEHIIAEWMLRDCDLYNTKFRLGFGQANTQGGVDTVTQPQALGGFYSMDVCGSCNNNWMSRLENRMKYILQPFIQTAWPADDKELFKSLFLDSGIIARWLLKTACTFGEKMSVEVPEKIRRSLCGDTVPAQISFDVAYNQQCGLYMAMSRQWNVCKGEIMNTMHIEKESFRLTWQVRHLVMRVHYFPGCEMNMVKPRFPVRIYPNFGVLPDYVETGITKRSFHYKTLEQLEHETCYVWNGLTLK